jgi:hypothetical protein
MTISVAKRISQVKFGGVKPKDLGSGVGKNTRIGFCKHTWLAEQVPIYGCFPLQRGVL